MRRYALSCINSREGGSATEGHCAHDCCVVVCVRERLKTLTCSQNAGFPDAASKFFKYSLSLGVRTGKMQELMVEMNMGRELVLCLAEFGFNI